MSFSLLSGVRRSVKQLLLILFALSVLVSGCSLPTNDNPPDQKNVEFKPGEKAQCLSEVLPIMHGFMRGDATSSQVEQTWDCFRVALNLFSTYVQGRDASRYTARELANFFERYFFKNIKISNTFLTEVMRLKQIFVGGENETLTRDELFKLMAFADEMKVISLRLLPYMRVYSFNWKVSHVRTLENDVHYFEDANSTIQEAAKELASLIAKNDKSYDMDNFIVLVDEISKVYGQTWSWITELQKVMPLVHKLKKTLAGGSETSIAPKEWRSFALLGARGYIQYLRYYYFIKANDELGGGPELVYLAHSFDDLFSYLGDMVREKPQGVFTRAELLEVLQVLGQFWPQFKISDSFLFEAMKIKRLIFGGNLDNFTPDDFQRARSKVDVFRHVTEKFLVYASLYGLNWQPELMPYPDAVRYFQDGETKLIEVAKEFGASIEDVYNLQDILRIAAEFEILYPPENSGISIVALVKQYLPLAISAKELILADQGPVIGKDQWGRFLVSVSKIYGQAMSYHYFLKPSDVSIFRGNGLTSLGRWFDDTLAILQPILQARPNQTLLFADLEKIMANVYQAKLMPKTFPIKAAKDLVRVALTKIFIHPENRLQGKIPAGLNLEALTVLNEEFLHWFGNQKFFQEFYKDYQPGQAVDGAKVLAAMRSQPPTVGLRELIANFESPQSRAFDGLGRLVIWQEPSPYSPAAADMVNLSRMISRLLLRSYAGDLERIQKYVGINQLEANLFYADIKPLFVILGMLEEQNTTFAESIFREANLFTPRANGDAYLSFVETNDIVLNIFSGLKLDGYVREKLLSGPNSCPILGARETGKEKISVNCFANVYYREINSIFASMPSMRTYLAKLPRCQLLTENPWLTDPGFVGHVSDSDLARVGNGIDMTQYISNCSGSFDTVLLSMLTAAGYRAEKDGLVSLDDTALVPHVMQYIETVVQRFDRVHYSDQLGRKIGKDGVLDNVEAVEAFPIFRRILSDVSGYKDDKTLLGLFAWFLEKGKPPQSTWEKVNFYILYRNQPDRWKISADRSKLAAILGFIADEVSKKEKAIIGDDPTGETTRATN